MKNFRHSGLPGKEIKFFGGKPKQDDIKICKECWFEKRNGHARGCSKETSGNCLGKVINLD